MARIYVASSWRNEHQPVVVQALREDGHDVYDFRNPKPDNHGFSWSDIDPNWHAWGTEEFVKGLRHPIAISGYDLDMDALDSCEVCVLALPSGRSAHLEAGYARGAGKTLAILLDPNSPTEPELMYRMADWVGDDLDSLRKFIKEEMGDALS